VDLDVFKPTFLIQIAGQELFRDTADVYIWPQEITSFVFEDKEEELDVADEYIRMS